MAKDLVETPLMSREKPSDAPWGFSPGHMALPDVRTLNLMKELQIPTGVLAALARLFQAIANDDVLYRRYLALAQRLQGTSHGLLSDVIEAMRIGA